MELKKAAAIAGVATLGYLGYALVTAQTPKISRAEGVCSCGTECVCECGCAESGVCNCGPSCPCDCGCGDEPTNPSTGLRYSDYPFSAESLTRSERLGGGIMKGGHKYVECNFCSEEKPLGQMRRMAFDPETQSRVRYSGYLSTYACCDDCYRERFKGKPVGKSVLYAESHSAETRFIPVQVMEVTEWFKDRFGHYPDFSRQEGSKFHSGYAVVVRGQMVDRYDTKEEADLTADAIRIAISFLGGMTADDGTHPRSQREMIPHEYPLPYPTNPSTGLPYGYDAESFGAESVWCDNCGDDLGEEDAQLGDVHVIQFMPVDFDSGEAGESATICGKCYEDLVGLDAESSSAEGHEDECGGTACPECGLCDCQGDSNPCCESFSAELKKDSCCCGATKSKPCACMIEGVIDCSPTCPCFVASALKATREATENIKDPYEEYMELGEERIGRTGEAWDEIADRFFEKYGWKKPHYGYDTDRETNTLWVDTSGEEKERWEDTGIPAKKGEWLLTDMWDEAEWMGYQEWCKYEGKGEWDNEGESFSADVEMIECGNCDETFTIDEGLDIGGIDYCEECYDTISAKDLPFDAESFAAARHGVPCPQCGEICIDEETTEYDNWVICNPCRIAFLEDFPAIQHSRKKLYDMQSNPQKYWDAESFSADVEMIECGNCDETFTIDEGLDIGGIDYCEECYDTISAKDIPFDAESFSEAGLELRNAGRCGCHQDDVWKVVNVESPVFLCGTCGYAGNKKEDGHFRNMKAWYEAETFEAPVHKDECTVCVGFADLKDLAPDYEVFHLCDDCITKAKTMNAESFSAEEIWVKNAEGNFLGPISEAEWSYLKHETEDDWAGEAITETALWDEEDDGADEDAIAHYTANFNNENYLAEYMAEPRKGGKGRFMDPKQVIDLFKKANGTLVSVTFVKRTNGEIRKMLARTSVRKGVKGVGLKFKPSDKNLMGVYDFGEVRKGADPWKCYRFVPVDAVLSLRVRGKTYTA